MFQNQAERHVPEFPHIDPREITWEKTEEAKRFLYDAMVIGAELLRSGAEVSRVEDTIKRICLAYGATHVNVFSITASIVVTISGPGFGTITQTRRVTEMQYDLKRLEMLNQLSRDICSKLPGTGEIEEELKKIDGEREYSFPLLIAMYAFVAGSFTVFFGGSFSDAFASALIGVVLKICMQFLKKLQINNLLTYFACSLLGGTLAFWAVKIGIGQSADLINIGDIMLLIPGIALTNGIRDMINGDMISGLIRFSAALLLAVVLAFGFVLASSYLA